MIDGLGALLSAFILGVVLVQWEQLFGLPSATLYFLALWPIIFALYDFYAYRLGRPNAGPYLRGIAVMNLLYCVLSLGCAFYHADSVTIWGWSYILVEIGLVLMLAYVEYKVSERLMA